MAETRKPDFSGYVTKYGLLCADGRTIQKDAFKHMDGTRVPLVWQHLHNDPNNILGHVILSHRDDGVYGDAYLNDSHPGKQAGILVAHKDVTAFSIYANKLVEKKSLVHSGDVKEVSLVIAGANPGAFIEHITLSHSDGSETQSEDEAIVSMFIPFDPKQEETTQETVAHADPPAASEETVADVVESMDDKQKKVLYALVAQALGQDGNSDAAQSNSEGETFMKKNLFEREGESEGVTLTHDQLQEFAGKVFADAQKSGSFKEAFLAHAGTYGIDNIEYLFPDARIAEDPSFDTRRMGWVPGWLSGTKHQPFSRIKKIWADLTPDAARAKGYIKGNQKIEQVFALLKRSTEPTTIYKKQKLDRDDIIDITDFNVVTWMWKEMRFMLDEEVARAALVGDGRVYGTDDDAIDPSKIRPIYGDEDLFVEYLQLENTVTDPLDIIDAILQARINYKGSGTPNLYTTNAFLTQLLLVRDTTNRRLYRTVAELAAELRVGEIVEVEILNGVTREDGDDNEWELLGIIVNPRDYTYGADKGGSIATFEDFDIDYNQNKYLIETRLSGSLLDPKSAFVVERAPAAP
jgi:hypothetical protein